MSSVPPTPAPAPRRSVITAWAAWDWASAAFNAVVTTFVFSVYLTSEAFGPDATKHWGTVLGLAGAVVALFAPVSGQRADAGGTRVRSLRINTVITALAIAGLFFVRPGEEYLLLGLVLVAIGNVAFELSSVNYNAMLPDIAPPGKMGRVSAFGWGAGYVGGIILLLILFFGFISPEVGLFGVTGEDGLDVRVSMLLCAVWTLVFSAPILLMARDDVARRASARRESLLDSYRYLIGTIARLWHEDRRMLGFLAASAVYRDGLAGVFTFAGVLAAGSFGFSGGDVIVFAIAANLVAGLITMASGWLDDRLGPRRIILVALPTMATLGTLILVLHEHGPLVLWVCGLVLASLVGPVQSASRTFLARLIPPGKEGEIFGLYATTGRAVSFLAPFAFTSSIVLAERLGGLTPGDAQIWGILGIVAILLAGFVLMFFFREIPRRQPT